jgi:hypothetical protein
MHFTPQQMRAMSLFDYLASLDGFSADPDGGKHLSEDEKDELWEWLQAG